MTDKVVEFKTRDRPPSITLVVTVLRERPEIGKQATFTARVDDVDDDGEITSNMYHVDDKDSVDKVINLLMGIVMAHKSK